jgi:hypothetical protein
VQGEGANVREDKNGQEYYVSRSDGSHVGAPPEPPAVQWRETLADVETRDRTYRALLEVLSLSSHHLVQLRERGLSGETIARAGYRTLHWADGERTRAVRHVMHTAGSVYLLNVPGFFKRDGSKETRLGGSPGLLIPVRDEAGRILACLIRPDNLQDGGGKYRWLSAPPDAIGCGPGSLGHVPLHERGSAEIVRVTEGILKADVATALSSVVTVGMPGVGAWKQALPILKKLAPSKVLVAFDADARLKAQVAGPLVRLVEALRQEGYDVTVEVWPESAGKGIDDVLKAGKRDAIRLVRGAEVTDALAEIARIAGIRSKSVASSEAGEALSPEERKSQAQTLIELAAGVEFYHTPNGLLFADVTVDGHRETWSVASIHFEHWLALRMYRTHGKPPNGQALNDALAVFAAQARFDGPERAVHLRVADAGGCIYVDLVNDAWEAVEISPTGWRVVGSPPVRFRRTPGMRPLPRPAEGGSLDALRRFVNLENEDDWTLAVGWLLGALRARGPYPLAVLQGEQGSAKSTTARVLRELVDPNTSPLRAKPDKVEDLMVAATNGWVLCCDNLSGISTELSDGLCRLATGGGFGTRKFYSNSDEILLEAQRPAILTGIEITTRADLADRSLILTLPPIVDRARMSEEEFWSAFYDERPRILGALMTALSGALANAPNTVLVALPRMADFAKWVTAAEPALRWPRHAFLKAYGRNRGEAAAGTIDSDPVSVAMQRLIEREGDWEGSATELLGRLAECVSETVARGRAWPRTAHQLSGRLRRAAPALRTAGIQVDFGRTKHARTIALRRVMLPPVVGDAAGLGDADGADSVTPNPPIRPVNDAGDADDAPSLPLRSEGEGDREPSVEKDPYQAVLCDPLVAEAISVFAPPEVRVRLPDGSKQVVRLAPPEPDEGSTERHAATPTPERNSGANPTGAPAKRGQTA